MTDLLLGPGIFLDGPSRAFDDRQLGTTEEVRRWRGSAVVVAEDIPEIAAVLAEFVAAPEPYTIGSDPSLDLRAIAAEVRLLPAMLDMGGCLGLRPSGEVASFLWDEPRQLRAETDERIRNLAYHQASLEYPRLAPLVPRRPPDAVVCSCCGGSGRCSGLPDRLADSVVCYCGGLGWLPGKTAEPSAGGAPALPTLRAATNPSR